MKNACSVLILCASLFGQAYAADVVTTVKDENGWKLQVNGEDFYVKGVVWGYSPRDENYNYNLWGKSDDFIRKVLDYEFGLMKAAGVNAIRSFNIMPPKWVTYVYREHGIMTVINPLMGRYGDFIGGRWVEFVDYSDDLTRETLKKTALELVEEYKNVPGVLMFALGNESNYGLSWKSFEIENLPVGEQNTAKARYLYSLFNETMKAGKAIDPNHPFTIVNGDLQYIDLIDEYCTDMDLLGVNAYRGANFQGGGPIDLWQEVDEKLDLPVLFFEFGSDAYNARTGQEDQLNQARIIKDQWQEMYNKSYGNGEEGNSIGGFQFEWRDEWWKYLQEERLDIHDTNASWANDAYPHDFVAGQNNMNEEWWGIAALGTINSDGVYEAIPRMAYDVLSEVWSMDPYTYKKSAINQAFTDMNMEYLALKSDVRMLKSESEEKRKLLYFTGGSAKVEFLQKGNEADIDEFGDAGDEFSDGQMVFLDFGFAPTEARIRPARPAPRGADRGSPSRVYRRNRIFQGN
jgi:beta-galactosidase/beta-glucuronidase